MDATAVLTAAAEAAMGSAYGPQGGYVVCGQRSGTREVVHLLLLLLHRSSSTYARCGVGSMQMNEPAEMLHKLH